MTPHYWNQQQVNRLLEALAELDKREAYLASLIMWRAGLRIGQVMELEWRDIDLSERRVRVHELGAGGDRTVPLHRGLVAHFEDAAVWRGPRDTVLRVSYRTVLRHIRECIEAAKLDSESPGTGVQKAGAHSLRHSAVLHWLKYGVPLHVVSEWLGHANILITLRTYRPIIGNSYDIDDVP